MLLLLVVEEFLEKKSQLEFDKHFPVYSDEKLIASLMSCVHTHYYYRVYISIDRKKTMQKIE